MYQLTSEGEEYLKRGLPEKRLIKSLSTLKKSINELKDSIPNLNIAISWARKNNWIKIGELVELTEEGKKAVHSETEIEKALEKVSNGKQIPEEMAKLLMSRNLVIEVKEVEKPKKSFLRAIFKKQKETNEISEITTDILKTKKWKNIPIKRYDIYSPAPEIFPGKKHIVNQALEQMRRIWIEMGFKEMHGSEVEVSFWNFDALFTAQDHPVREMQDTYYMKIPKEGKIPEKLASIVKATHENGWITGSTGWQYKWKEENAKKMIMRTHTTCLSARTLANLKPEDLPAKYFSIGKCFRNEALDWKHLFEFFQVEGIVVDPNANFRNLLGYLKRFFNKLGFEHARFRPAYFPYTEMSLEIEVLTNRGWIELGGAGIFRPEVTKPLLGHDIPVLAWGPGLDRMIMMAYDIKDIRDLYNNDLKILRNAKVWVK